jgi:hypothetical protein
VSGFVFRRGYAYRRNLTYHVKHDHEGKECTYVDCGEEPASEVSAFMYIKCSVDLLLDCVSQLH